ncbi:hypothetical protein NRF20_37925 [Streptomyces sp. R-74717]|uniref:hypothetical protein n=1 Tax=Streptomyces TaxID=1883 RepID=UPI0037A30260
MSRLIPRKVFRSMILTGVLAMATGFAVQVEYADSRALEGQPTAGYSETSSAGENDHGWQ